MNVFRLLVALQGATFGIGAVVVGWTSDSIISWQLFVTGISCTLASFYIGSLAAEGSQTQPFDKAGPDETRDHRPLTPEEMVGGFLPDFLTYLRAEVFPTQQEFVPQKMVPTMTAQGNCESFVQMLNDAIREHKISAVAVKGDLWFTYQDAETMQPTRHTAA